MHRRLLVVAPMVVGLVMVTVPVVSAAPPVRGSWTNQSFGPGAVTNVCPFVFDVSGIQSLRFTIVIKADGTALENDHWVEQDTFTNPANGTVLSGDPYTGNYHATYDANGALVSWYVTGGIETVNLPGGSVFWTAGRTNVLADPADFIFTADFGHSGNLTAFCDALS